MRSNIWLREAFISQSKREAKRLQKRFLEKNEEFRNILSSYRELLMADKIMAKKFIIQTYEKTKKTVRKILIR
ncbi:MAG: hypothetical protein NC922_05850 [Candidatus Omnitrophica bacterium]|nr:hypothetical protein [Candidatus Omnitrophota bacterium]